MHATSSHEQMGRGGEYGHGEEEREPQEQEEADPVEDHRGEAPLVLGLAGVVLIF